MTESPGHQKWPDHKVEEKPLQDRVQVQVGEDVVADSTHVVEVDEDKHPDRFYIPRSDIRMDALRESDTRTKCPFKGEAHYYNLEVGGQRLEDAAWSYEDPYDEHGGLKDLVAFHQDKPGIEVRRGA